MSVQQNILIVNCGDNPTPASEHNYIVKVLAMQRAGLLPSSGVFETYIRHDDWVVSWPVAGAIAIRIPRWRGANLDVNGRPPKRRKPGPQSAPGFSINRVMRAGI
jgi:hypothetical protein